MPILVSVRLPYSPIVLVCLIGLAGCRSSSETSATKDITKEPWYGQMVEQLAILARDADAAYKNGKPDEASALIKKAEPLRDRAVAPSKPTLAALEAASDLDDLYGRMLLHNRHYGWARLQFQKNVARWKRREPKTPDTERRYKDAVTKISECDEKMIQ